MNNKMVDFNEVVAQVAEGKMPAQKALETVVAARSKHNVFEANRTLFNIGVIAAAVAPTIQMGG